MNIRNRGKVRGEHNTYTYKGVGKNEGSNTREKGED